jgi:AhpD family alkylhydroperoxidase
MGEEAMVMSTCTCIDSPAESQHPWADVQDELRRPSAELRRLIPEVYAGFAELHGAALSPGALDTKTKELMALALAVAARCDGCIAAHARSAARLGASEREVAETLGVVLLMAGGPATVYGPRALAAFREFAGSDQSMNQLTTARNGTQT